MNNEKMVTRCPQCGTSFRITPSQLHSARGAVRCGACLHIFKARDHLVGGPIAKGPSSALVRKPTQRTPAQGAGSQQPPGKAPPPRPTQVATDPKRESKAPGQGPKAQPASGSASGSQQAGARRPASGRPAPGQSKPLPNAAEKTQLRFNQASIDSEPESESFDDDDFLISDDMGQSKPGEKDPFGIARQAQGNTHSLFERVAGGEEEDSDSRDDTDESWAMSLLEDEEEDSSSAATLSRADDAQRVLDEEDIAERSPSFELTEAPTEAQLAEAAGDDSLRFQLENEREPDEPEQSYEGERLRAHDAERSALLMNIDPEPVEMNWTRQQHRQPTQRKWLWSGLAVIALITLAAQFAWLQLDRLSRIEPYRSVYEFACPLVGCDVPPMVNRSRIRAYNLVVRNHPEAEGALIVDAILLNTARFSQPFPELVLEFSDLNGTALAARTFVPGEYLSGELAGREVMPPNQPIHLTLELVDPGERAVNYRAYIPD